MTDQRKVPTPATDDRLCSLPEEIITHILSSFETKYAVRTTVLSRWWKDLWTRVPNLDFDFWNWARKHALAEKEEMRVLRFCRFVNKVLSQHQSLDSLRCFRLHFTPTQYKGKVRLDFGVWRVLVFGSQIEEIDVMFLWGTGFGVSLRQLPESFCALKNLKVLKLEGVIMTENGSVSLPSLKVLKLREVVFDGFESLGRLISGCPILETLSLEFCCNVNDMLTASLPSLRNLTIIHLPDDGDDETDICLCHIAIDAPNLEYLYLEHFTELQFLGSSPLPCLYSAEINTDFGAGLYEGLIRLLAPISNAKKMRFNDNALEILSSVGEDVQLPVFPNLTYLQVKPGIRSWILHSLLHSASNLRSLVISLCSLYGPMVWDETKPTCTPECLLSSLEEIQINDFDPTETETDMKMVGYLLNVGAVLKKVDLNLFSSPTKEERKELRWLLNLPRESSSCDVRLLFLGIEIDINIDDDATNIDDKDEIDLDDEDEDEDEG